MPSGGTFRRICAGLVLVIVVVHLVFWAARSIDIQETLHEDRDQARLPQAQTDHQRMVTPVQSAYSTFDLTKAIRHLESLPILDSVDAIQINEASCPRNPELANPFEKADDSRWWMDFSPKDVEAQRTGIINAMERLHSTKGWSEAHRDRGDGIVIAAGNADTISRAVGLIRFLREELHSTLPIALAHYPAEIDESTNKALERFVNVSAYEVTQVSKKAGEWKAFQLKPAAILDSPFQRVVYLDSDNTPLLRPELLFRTEEFEQTGMVLWPDYFRAHPAVPSWRVIAVTCLEEFTTESGQMLLDLGRTGVLAAIHLAAYMCSGDLLVAADRSQADAIASAPRDFWLRVSAGDKDTFKYALRALRVPYEMPKRYLGMLGAPTATGFCGHTMLQMGLTPLPALLESETEPLVRLLLDAGASAPAFVHANLVKHISQAQLVSPRPLFATLRTVKDDIMPRVRPSRDLVNTLFGGTREAFNNGKENEANLKSHISSAAGHTWIMPHPNDKTFRIAESILRQRRASIHPLEEFRPLADDTAFDGGDTVGLKGALRDISGSRKSQDAAKTGSSGALAHITIHSDKGICVRMAPFQDNGADSVVEAGFEDMANGHFKAVLAGFESTWWRLGGKIGWD